MNQNTNQHTTLWFALCIICVGLAAHIAIPAAAQEAPSTAATSEQAVLANPNPPGTVTKTCVRHDTPGCIIMVTNGNGIPTRYIEDITAVNPGGNNNLHLVCQTAAGADVGRDLEIDPGAGAPIIAFACPGTAQTLIMRCEEGESSCTIRFAIF